MVFLGSGCNPAKRVSKDRLLLQSNNIQLQERRGITSILEQTSIRTFEDNIDYDELESIIKQRPNKRILGVPFYLWVYNLPNPERIERRRERNSEKFARRDAKRAKRAKPPYKTLGEWLMETVGEPPVLFEANSMKKTSEQMQNYLINKGYFNNKVVDSVHADTTRRRASVFYTILPGRPYTIKEITRNIADPRIDSIFEANKAGLLFKEGSIFDVDKMEKEQNRITNMLLNQGYFYFNKEFVSFDVDSSLKSFQVTIRYNIDNPRSRSAQRADSIIVSNHPVNYIRNVYINTDFIPGVNPAAYDTVRFGEYYILYKDELEFTKRLLTQSNYIIPGNLYQKDRVTNSYRRLSSLGPFKAVSISLDNATKTNVVDSLDVTINLIQAKRQIFTTEGRGTNKGGDLGVYGTFTYTNRNMFKGAENFDISLRGGIEAQQLFTDQANDLNDLGFRNNLTFNTIEFGPEFRLTVPRFLLPKFLLPAGQDRITRSYRPTTQFIFSLNYQGRPDFERIVTTASYNYAWQQNPKVRHIITPLEVNVIDIEKSAIFDERLQQLNNPLLTNSFSNHFIVSSAYSHIYNDGNASGNKIRYYNRFNVESSGNTLRTVFNLADFTSLNNEGGYEIFGTQFAHYLKTDNDFRLYKNLSEKTAIVARVKGGVAVPLANLNTIPFDKAYFTGGANFQRGWRARTLGPGSFLDTLGFNISDKIGDIILEGNFEIRFPLFGFFEGALFADVGNIWLLSEDSQRPGAHFELNRFWREFGIGSGFGLRMDLSFFIIRLDLGVKVRDPKLPESERWFWQSKDQYNAIIGEFNERNFTNVGPYRNPINLNIGIGYPF